MLYKHYILFKTSPKVEALALAPCLEEEEEEEVEAEDLGVLEVWEGNPQRKRPRPMSLEHPKLLEAAVLTHPKVSQRLVACICWFFLLS